VIYCRSYFLEISPQLTFIRGFARLTASARFLQEGEMSLNILQLLKQSNLIDSGGSGALLDVRDGATHREASPGGMAALTKTKLFDEIYCFLSTTKRLMSFLEEGRRIVF